jgi:aminoglycoside/choline kinase family phosphotransferase
MRSWNLSLLIRLTTDEGVVWPKHVPPFLRHEGAVMALVREERSAVPTILGAAPAAGRLLLEDVPGDDAYLPTAGLAVRMVESLVALQLRMTKRRTSITAAGGLDWSSATFLQEMPRLAARRDVRTDLDRTEQSALDQLVRKLPAMLDALYACGLEDTLVHGDFHPGNHRFNGEKLVLLDWGDSGLGHPLLDMASFLDRIPIEQLDTVRRTWDTAWKDAYPNANVSLAAELIRPLAALRAALIYRRFLDGIEASERVYHNLDASEWLRRAISVAPL